MLIITNDFKTPPKEIIETYAFRWLIEHNIQEDVNFFSIANTPYKISACKFKPFDKAKPKTIYRNIVEGAAKKIISAPIPLTSSLVKTHLIDGIRSVYEWYLKGMK